MANNQKYTFNDCTIDNCSAISTGGAIYDYGENTSMEFDDSLIQNCKSTAAEGGAIATINDNVNYKFSYTDIKNSIKTVYTYR